MYVNVNVCHQYHIHLTKSLLACSPGFALGDHPEAGVGASSVWGMLIDWCPTGGSSLVRGSVRASRALAQPARCTATTRQLQACGDACHSLLHGPI